MEPALMTWNLAEAKNRLSEVVNLALSQGPQTITRRKDAVVVLSAATYEKLAGKRQSFKEFLFEGPSFEGIELDRDQSTMRDVEL
jgi:prevent-host-death family protein